MMNQKEQKNKWAGIPLRVWVGYMLVCSLLLTGVTFSSYITAATGGDGAQVAKFSVAIVSDDDEVKLDGSQSDEDPEGVYTFRVENHSEVAVSYTIAVETETGDPLPKGVEFKIGEEVRNSDGVQKVFSFPGGTLGPNENSQVITLTVTALLADLTVDVDQEITVRIHADQVD